jgi:hypothetical protein
MLTVLILTCLQHINVELVLLLDPDFWDLIGRKIGYRGVAVNITTSITKFGGG